MKALILAAGLGSRLAPITNDKPKSLVEVNGMPILFRQIENLQENNINDITIVTGYKSEILENKVMANYKGIKFITSADYRNTNNMYSAYIGIKSMFADNNIKSFLMMNADVFYDSVIVKDLLSDGKPNMIAVDKGAFNDESMKIEVKNRRIIDISKEINKDNAYGCSIDVYKFGSDGGKAFFNICSKYIEKEQNLKRWSEVALAEILSEIEFAPLDINGRWLEIDNHDDLKNAEMLFSK